MDHHNIASTLSWHGLRAESAYVLRMGEQRAELLEALKPFAKGNWTKELALAAKAAITRAEASE